MFLQTKYRLLLTEQALSGRLAGKGIKKLLECVPGRESACPVGKVRARSGKGTTGRTGSRLPSKACLKRADPPTPFADQKSHLPESRLTESLLPKCRQARSRLLIARSCAELIIDWGGVMTNPILETIKRLDRG